MSGRRGARTARAWLLPALLAVLAYAAVLAVRLGDLPKWDQDRFRVDGEYIMATHDAYAWLAGAYGVGTAAGTPLARLARAYADRTGRPAAEFAFFAPAVAAPLVAAVVALWAWTLGGAEAGLGAGLLAALVPGFYFRTRLGYYDTDVVTLFFPLLQSWLLAHWLAPGLRRLRFAPPGPADQEEAGPPAPASLGWPLAAGLLARLGGADWHGNLLDFYLLAAGIAALLALALARPGTRPRLLRGLAVLALAGFHGNVGLAAALGLALVPRLLPRLAFPGRFGTAALALLLLAALAVPGRGLMERAAGKFAMYSKATVEVAEESAGRNPESAPGPRAGPPPVYPGVTQSVVEAQGVPLGQALAQILPWSWLTLAGLAGFAALAVVRPAAALLLPLGLMALLAHRLGVRLAMFGGPPAALGLLLPVAWGARALVSGGRGKAWAGFLAASALALGVSAPLLRDYAGQPPTPVLGAAHARALKALAGLAPADGRVWTWWDWGYATQYYARRMTFADGARHSGEYLFPQALVLATASPLQAGQVISFAADRGYAPWEEWDRGTGAAAMESIARMARERLAPRPRERQYLVVAWENLRLLYWISYYGTWDLAAGGGEHGSCREAGGRFRLDGQRGVFAPPGGEASPLSSLDEAGPGGLAHRDYPGQAGAHLIVNQFTRQAMLLDDLAYGSMMVQLLVGDPGRAGFRDSFRLVYEGFPLVRIYEVL